MIVHLNSFPRQDGQGPECGSPSAIPSLTNQIWWRSATISR
ncbi:hypothetical protein BVG79_01169 [Ketogulonicigenium robustum]|uniref:Uncharacterized protein n=1 Tax=Ketogulonicigenium robustum TaxID=92947 RepID=A0A1W6NZ48_9RHOB|nr:hypothetical protein BVG79_01169 [Ketogulonicigenium robustum]